MPDPSSGGAFAQDFVPSLRQDYLRRDIDGQAVVWSPDRPFPLALDPAATIMLDVIDGDASIAQLAREVSDEVGVSLEVASGQLTRIVDGFGHGGLLDTSGPGQDARRAIAERVLMEGPPST